MAFPGLTVLYHYENHVLIWTQTINHSINLNKLLSFKFCLIVVKRRLKICAVWPAPWRCTNSGNNHTDLIHRLAIPYWHWSLRSAVVSHFMDQLDPSWQNNWPFLCYCNVKFPPSPISCKVNNTSSKDTDPGIRKHRLRRDSSTMNWSRQEAMAPPPRTACQLSQTWMIYLEIIKWS